ncbi:DUF4247 domain-containing protein [Streptomyces sp. NPDC051018]|uniref:DUF4247 domain-containing protein n=1 Tax=Streptomyces sp. NPDC051018 TaxID=3365639 RepID=UPI003792642C
MKNVRRVGVMILATVALAACSKDPEKVNDVPTAWIQGEYTADAAGYVDTTDTSSRVATEIDDHASARGRTSDGDKVFLRYRDDIVAVSPYLKGSLIEIADYRTGYQRWQKHLRSVWPSPDSNEFRGGGPGSGK